MQNTRKKVSKVYTASDAEVYLDDIDNADIRLYDISYGLSHTTRWSGQFGKCTVAKHSALVTYLVDGMLSKSVDDNARLSILRYALMHDATEAYLGEVPVLVKELLPAYRELEHTLFFRIQEVLGIEDISDKAQSLISVADTMATVVERMVYHTLRVGGKPQLVVTKDGDYVTAYTKKKNDILHVHMAYKGHHVWCPAGRTFEQRIPSWEWYLVDLFGAFSL